MAKPAIGRNVQQQAPYFFQQHRQDGSTTMSERSFTRSFVYESAPATRVGQFILDGSFRLPTPWNHYGAYGVLRGPTVSRVRPSVPGDPTRVIRETWTDGGFWPLVPLTGNSDMPSWLRNLAELKALENLKDQKVNFALAFLEAHLTIRLVGDTFNRIANSIRRWRRSHSRREWNKVKRSRGSSVPRSWLELQYGWNPVLNDMYNACDALRSVWNRGALISCKGNQTRRSSARVRQNGNFPGSYYDLEEERFDGVGVQLWFKLLNAELAALSSWGITNPLALVWERVPYSFVLDWALPVGRWLNVLDADFGLGFVTGRRSVKRVARFEVVGYRLPESSPWKWDTGGAPDLTRRYQRFDRHIYTSSPVPGLNFKSPFSLGHVANGLSLLAQALDRR